MERPSKLALISAFAALYLVWGSTYLFIRFAIGTLPPFLMAGSRFLCAGLLIYFSSRLRGTERPHPGTWRDAAIIGGCLLLCGNGGVTIAETFIDSGLAAVVVATVPIYIALLAWLSGSAPRPSLPVALGLAGGMIGVGLLLAPSLHFDRSSSHRSAIGMAILLGASFLWSVGTLYSRRARIAKSTLLAAGQQMICGGILLLLTSLITREKFQLSQLTPLSVWSWIYLVLIGAIIGYGAYAFLLRHCDPAKVATYAYVNPIVAVLLGSLFAGEHFTLRMGMAAALILGSVAIVITAQSLRPAPEGAWRAPLPAVD